MIAVKHSIVRQSLKRMLRAQDSLVDIAHARTLGNRMQVLENDLFAFAEAGRNGGFIDFNPVDIGHPFVEILAFFRSSSVRLSLDLPASN